MHRHPLPLSTLVATLLLAGLLVRAPAAGAVGIWTPAASPSLIRAETARSLTVLADGRVLVIGIYPNIGDGQAGGTARLYDPAADRWAAAAPFDPNAGNAAPVLLRDGRVLVVGGVNVTPCISPGCRENLNTAQIYDPAKNTWTKAAPLRMARAGHTATLLPDGTVLVVGGDTGRGSQPTYPTATAERYDPRTDRWSDAAPLAATRAYQAAASLRDGRVLIVGGISSGPAPAFTSATTDTAVLYDPAANRWALAATAPRLFVPGPTATPLADGRVLVMGTAQEAGGRTGAATALVYAPETDAWTATPPFTTLPAQYTTTLLPSGWVLAAGNASPAGAPVTAVLLYDPVLNAWAGAAPPPVPSFGLPLATLHDGRVFALGGVGGGTTIIYTPAPGPAACFPETGKCIRGPFLAYWLGHGGLAVNGYPLSDEFIQVLEDGKAYQVQYFERVRMEYHPENPAPWDIELGQFGRRVLQERTGHGAAPPAQPQGGFTYFQITGHNVAPDSFQYWQAHGGLAQFGYPLTEEFQERLEDGKVYTVQYFERARFERHPENPAPWQIELGQFGRQILAEGGR